MTFDLSVVNKKILKITTTPSESEATLFANGFTVNVIKYVPADSEDYQILDVLITRNEPTFSEGLHTFIKDGYYKITNMVIYDKSYATENKATGYCTDGTLFYKVNAGVIQNDEQGNPDIKPLEELLEVNDDTLLRQEQETFSICYLHECYLELCDKKFKQLMRNRCNKKEDVEDFNLDLIGLSLNAIRYNLEFGYINNAQTIIEDLNRCVNICKINHKSNECGCCN